MVDDSLELELAKKFKMYEQKDIKDWMDYKEMQLDCMETIMRILIKRNQDAVISMLVKFSILDESDISEGEISKMYSKLWKDESIKEIVKTFRELSSRKYSIYYAMVCAKAEDYNGRD